MTPNLPIPILWKPLVGSGIITSERDDIEWKGVGA